MIIRKGEILFASICLTLGALGGSLFIAPCGPGSSYPFFIALLAVTAILIVKGPRFTRFLGIGLAILFLAGLCRELLARQRFQAALRRLVQEKRMEQKNAEPNATGSLQPAEERVKPNP